MREARLRAAWWQSVRPCRPSPPSRLGVHEAEAGILDGPFSAFLRCDGCAARPFMTIQAHVANRTSPQSQSLLFGLLRIEKALGREVNDSTDSVFEPWATGGGICMGQSVGSEAIFFASRRMLVEIILILKRDLYSPLLTAPRILTDPTQKKKYRNKATSSNGIMFPIIDRSRD